MSAGGECSLPYQNRVSWLQSLMCFSHHLPDVAKVFQILSEQAGYEELAM